MKTKKVQKIVGGYMEKITGAAAQVEACFDEEVIHALRVNVKRLRAFLRLYWLFSGGAKPLLPKKVKKLYRAAGEIRDLQLLLKKVAGNDKLPEVYHKALEEQLAAAKDAWIETYDAKGLRSGSKKLSAYDYKSIPAFIPGEFVKERLRLIDELRAAGSSDDEDLHTIRKRVKDIVYIMRLVNDDWGKAMAAIQHIPGRKAEELADVVGDFNDTRQLKAKLGALRVRGASEKDAAARRRFVAKVGKDLDSRRAAIAGQLAELGEGFFF